MSVTGALRWPVTYKATVTLRLHARCTAGRRFQMTEIMIETRRVVRSIHKFVRLFLKKTLRSTKEINYFFRLIILQLVLLLSCITRGFPLYFFSIFLLTINYDLSEK